MYYVRDRYRTREQQDARVRAKVTYTLKVLMMQVTREFPRSKTLPKTRGDCPKRRPCPHVSCRHHLKFDEKSTGGLIENRPDLSELDLNDPDYDPCLEALDETCSLDVADRGQHTLDVVGDYMGLTRERIRQIEKEALAKLKQLGVFDGYW